MNSIPDPINILLIDDNPDDRELAKRAIRKDLSSAQFIEVIDQESFRTALEAAQFHVVVTDFKLGWNDGLAVLRIIKEKNNDTPVVMFTNTGSEETCAEGMKEGLSDYIIKRREHFPKLPAAIRSALELLLARQAVKNHEVRLAQLLERERLARAEAESARIEAERANKLKDDFLTTVSHELRSPLNAVLGWVQLIRMKRLSPEAIENGVEVIERNTRAQVRLIEDLLDLSRVVNGRIRLEVKNLDLIGIINAAVEGLQPEAERKGIIVEQILDPSAGPVRGDNSRVHQIITNLLSNAIKFTPEGGKVQVSLSRVHSHVEIKVSDNGQGITPEFLPYIFDRFRQADSSITRKHGGLGIGLSIVKSLVELHGGKITAASEGEGKGAAFTVCFSIALMRESDLALQEDSFDKGGSEDRSKMILENLVVLAVDDDHDNCDIIKRVLELYGATVFCASSGKEGIQVLKSKKIDVLLSDIGMPGEDGFSFIAEVRDLPADQNGNVPAAAVTAFARSEDRQRALLAGFDVHLMKPVEPTELITVVATLAKRPYRAVK